LFRLLAQIAKAVFGGNRCYDVLGEGIEMEGETGNILQEGIVELARNPRPFGEPLFIAHGELRRNVPDTQEIDAPEQAAKGRQAEKSKPRGLVKRGRDGKRERSARLIPDSVVIAGDNVEAVLPGR
jgi:hypothetical protein